MKLSEFANDKQKRLCENGGVIKSGEERTTKPRVHNGFLGWQGRYRESRRRIHRQEVKGAITNHLFNGLGRRSWNTIDEIEDIWNRRDVLCILALPRKTVCVRV